MLSFYSPVIIVENLLIICSTLPSIAFQINRGKNNPRQLLQCRYRRSERRIQSECSRRTCVWCRIASPPSTLPSSLYQHHFKEFRAILSIRCHTNSRLSYHRYVRNIARTVAFYFYSIHVSLR